MVIDEDGQLRQRTAPRYDVALRDVGPEGWDRVRLHTAAALVGPENVVLAAFLNDCGLVMPEKYGRNVVGTCVLASFSAGIQPYAGPIVLTGWDPFPYGDDVEIRSLTDDLIAAIRLVHGDVRRVLGLDPGSPSAPPQWQEAIRDVAEVVRTGPTPAITVLHDDDVLAFLTRMRGGDRRA
jgi:hypothetical protein